MKRPNPPHALSLLALAALLASGIPSSQAETLLSEAFDYPDGPLVEVAASMWTTQSGTPGQVTVGAGAAILSQHASEDVRVALPGGPFAPDGARVLYAACEVRFTELPAGSGTYFAHFKDGGTGFRGRVFASTEGASEGSFRVGVSEAANSPTLLEADLNLGTMYRLVWRYDVDSAATMLWVNPKAESDPGVASADDGKPLAIHGLALRQSLSNGNGIGTVTIEDLRVATTFEEAMGLADPTPQIRQQPADAVVRVGETATLSVAADGEPPLVYQWLHDAVPIAHAEGSELHLPQVRPEDAGDYVVIVSNRVGSATSLPARLIVEQPMPGEIGAVVCELTQEGWLTLRWAGASGGRYSVLGAATPDGPWTILATELEDPEYLEAVDPALAGRYYRVRTP